MIQIRGAILHICQDSAGELDSAAISWECRRGDGKNGDEHPQQFFLILSRISTNLCC